MRRFFPVIPRSFLFILSFFLVTGICHAGNMKYLLNCYSNDNMSSATFDAYNSLVLLNGRWQPVPTNEWYLGYGTEIILDDGTYYVNFLRITDFYISDIETWTIPPNIGHTNYYQIYSNNLSVVIEGASAASWQLSSSPSEYTNSSFYSAHPGGLTNSVQLTTIPTGTYSMTFNSVRGYAKPSAASVDINGTPYDWYSTNAYIAYSNSLAVSVIGYPAGNVTWTVSAPADFTNATGYALAYTNNATMSAVPTGTYTFSFPGVVGYTTPTQTVNITGATLANVVTGIYVLAYPTNIPVGTGIQKFYQRSYFFTNVYLHDSGVPLHTRITDNIGETGATGKAATIEVAWSSNGVAGSSVIVTNVGTTNAAELGFIIPIGDTGATGATGATGDTGIAASIAVAWTSNGLAGTDVIVTNVGTTNAAEFGFVIPAGDTGATGETGIAASIAVAWTSNGLAGSSAIVTNVGTTNAAEFGFIIPASSEAAFTSSVAYAITAPDTNRWNTGADNAATATNYIGTNTLQAQITANSTSKVSKAGDTMTGRLNMYDATRSSTSASYELTEYIPLEKLLDELNKNSVTPLFGNTNTHSVVAHAATITREIPDAWCITNTPESADTFLVGTYLFTNYVDSLRFGSYIGRFYGNKVGSGTIQTYMELITTDGSTTNILDTSDTSGLLGTTMESYLQLTALETNQPVAAGFYMGISFYVVKGGVPETDLILCGGGTYKTSLETPGVAGTADITETDPVWESEKADYLLLGGDIMTGPLTNTAGYYGNGVGLTNVPGSGGSGFPLTNDVSLGGYTMSNGSFVGNGVGLTNISGAAEDWSSFAATQGVNFANYPLTNVNVLTVGGTRSRVALGQYASSVAWSMAIGRYATTYANGGMAFGGYLISVTDEYATVIAAGLGDNKSRGANTLLLIGNEIILGSWVKIEGDVDIDGHTISNGSYIGNGSGLTNITASETNEYQAYTYTLTPDAGGTCTVTYGHGSLVEIYMPATNITISFDAATYASTGGVVRVGVEIYSLTNSVSLDYSTCTNENTATKSTNDWTTWFFRRVGESTFKGRQ